MQIFGHCGKYKFGVRAGKNKLVARVLKYKLGASDSNYKLGDRAGGKGKDWGRHIRRPVFTHVVYVSIPGNILIKNNTKMINI